MSKQRKAPGNNFILAGLAVMIVLIPVKTLAFFENIDVNDFFSWGDEAIVITNKVEATANTGGNTAKEGKINTGSAKASVVVETKTDDDISEEDIGTSEKSNELPKEAPAGIDKKKGFIGHIIVSLTSFIQHVFSFFTFT